MSVVRFHIDRDTARPGLARLKRVLSDRGLNRAGAEGMLPPVQASLRGMAASNHNAFGVRSSFWNQMLAGTHAGVDDEGGFVAMPRPVALRAFGGTVTPKQSKYLAIPARTEAYGKSPKDFSDLRFILIPSGRFGQSAALVQTAMPTGQKTRGKRTKDAQGRKSIDPTAAGDGVYFWLVPQATIAANDEVLPKPAELQDAALEGVQTAVRVALRNPGALEGATP